MILPTSRRPHTVGYSIASVLRQTVSDFTLHVVGDGCDEKTEEVCRSFDDPRVRFHRFPKGPGFGYAHRNSIFRDSSAPMIAYTGDDDLLFPDHLERGARALEERTLTLAAFRSAQVRFPDDLDPHFFAFDWRPAALSRFLTRWFIGSANMIHRRTLFDRIGFWDESLFRFGDRDFYQRAAASGEPVEFLAETTQLRFFAAQWDRHYAALAEPPQKKYLDLLGDAAWRDDVRRRAAASRRPPAVRLAQARDFLLFAVKSGPKFARLMAGRVARSRR
ncbi:MAG: glycosyltransferase family 2 protein [Thermoanaerobaculia bacterium]